MKNTFTTLLLITAILTQAQVGIGVSTANIDASAQLEVASTSKGFLPPRMTATERGNIQSPAAGLLVFQTDAPIGLYYYTGSAWTIVTSDATGSNFVDVSTSQTIAGTKTFQDGLTVTNKPFLPPVLSQSDINALPTPTEGMVVYNSTTRKLQLYSVGSTDLYNDSFSGTFSSNVDYINQTFIAPSSGFVTQIQFYVKSYSSGFNCIFDAGLYNGVTNSSGILNFVVTQSPQWIGVTLNNPIEVQSGISYDFTVYAYNYDFYMNGGFGTNSTYSNGFAYGFGGQLNGNDIMFKLLITPASGSAYWVIMN
jgi:hypothetical protein